MRILPGTLLPNYLMLIVIENRVEKYHPKLLLFASQDSIRSGRLGHGHALGHGVHTRMLINSVSSVIGLIMTIHSY